MLYHVREVNIMMRSNDYNEDGDPDCVGIHVKDIRVITDPRLGALIKDKPGDRCPYNNVERVLTSAARSLKKARNSKMPKRQLATFPNTYCITVIEKTCSIAFAARSG